MHLVYLKDYINIAYPAKPLKFTQFQWRDGGVYEKTQEGILHIVTIWESFAMKYSFLFGEINDASLLFVIIFYTISVAFLQIQHLIHVYYHRNMFVARPDCSNLHSESSSSRAVFLTYKKNSEIKRKLRNLAPYYALHWYHL